MARRSPLSPLLLWLLLFQASASSQAAWVPHNLVFSQTQSFVSQSGGASAVPIALATATISTKLQNSTLDSDSVALSTLVLVFYGLLIIKTLILLALLPRALRNPCGLHRSLLEASNPAQATSPKMGGLSPSSQNPRSSSLTSE